MITSVVNNMRSTECFSNNEIINNEMYIKEENSFDSEDSNIMSYNSNFNLINHKTNNKYIARMNKGNSKDQSERRTERKNRQYKYDTEKSQNLERACKINDNCTDFERNIFIKEEIVIPDNLESVPVSDQIINKYATEDYSFYKKKNNWLNAKSILKSKIHKYRHKQELFSFKNVKNNQLIIQRKTKNNFYMTVGIVDTDLSLSKGIVQSVLSRNEIIACTSNDKISSNVLNNINDLESQEMLKSSTNFEKRIADENIAKEVETSVRPAGKYSKINLCMNGFFRIFENISKLQKEKILKNSANNFVNYSEDNNNSASLNIRIENVVSQAKTLPKNPKIINTTVTEKIDTTNAVSSGKSILKPKIHVLDTKSNKIIVTQGKASGKTKLFKAKKVETPIKVIKEMKSRCLLFCNGCLISQQFLWSDNVVKKCKRCFQEMKFMCSDCKEIFSSSVQFYVHDLCSCKVKIESGFYWKCNGCNYLVHKMTNCHTKFCKRHPLLKCKFCSSVTIHLSEFSKQSIKKSISKVVKETHSIIKTNDEDNLGIELDCTPLSAMPGQKLSSDKKFTIVCPAGCKLPSYKSSIGKSQCSLCGLFMRYKCLGCKALLKTYNAAYRHSSWCCSMVRTYYCASCDVFTQHSPDDALRPAPAEESAAHRCRNCLAKFDSRGRLNAHRLNCDESLWLQCGLCAFKLRTPRALRAHLDDVHREHANVALRAREFRFAVQAWTRSSDLLNWKAEKISESEKNRIRDQKMPMVLLEKLSDHIIQNLIDEHELWTCKSTPNEVQDVLPDECNSVELNKIDGQTNVDHDRPSFFNSYQTAYLNNINSLLEIPDSDEEVTSTDNSNLLMNQNQNPDIPFRAEEKISHNKTSTTTEKLSKQKVSVERSVSLARRRRIRNRRSEPLRCEHCGYLTNAKKELVEHIMSRHAARLFRGVGFDCPRCGCVFNNYHIYERHLQSRHHRQQR